jgi:MFS family permease
MTGITRTPARVISWVCFAHALSMAGFATYSTLLPRLQLEWALNNSEAGFISGVFFAGYMGTVPLLASLTDRIDARRVYLLSSLVLTLAVASMAPFARGLVSASLLQFLAGAGVAGTYMPGLRALTDNVSGTPAQSRAVSFYTAVFGAGASLSILLAGYLAGPFGWQAAFLVSAVGPLLAGLMVFFGLPAKTPPRQARTTHVLDFRPVWRARELWTYIVGYSVHCWELFGSRSWLVAFLVFSQTLMPSGAAVLLSPVLIAALANMLAPVSSILGNEAAMRWGRERVIWKVMLVSGLLTCTLGFASSASWSVLIALALVHMALVMGDSSALTAGVVTRADERIRGAAMAVHSMLGFGAGFVSPLVFGAVLDLAGGNASAPAWGWAFASLGVGAVLVSPFIRRRALAERVPP